MSSNNADEAVADSVDLSMSSDVDASLNGLGSAGDLEWYRDGTPCLEVRC